MRSSPPISLPACSLHDWMSLRSELLFAFDQPIPSAKLDGGGLREGDFSAWLVRRGRARMRADGEERTARAGQWLICFGKKIEQKFAPDTRLLSLRILQAWPDGSSLYSGGPLHLFEAADHPRLETLARRLLAVAGKISLDRTGAGADPRESFLWRNRLDYPSYIAYERHLLAWQAELARALLAEGREMRVPSDADPRLGRAFHFIDRLPLADPYPERELCRATGLTLGSLNRLCVRGYGFSLYSYWERRRVSRARKALELHGTPVKEIASELGFVQLSHFSAWFKRHAGKSPRAFRKGVGRSGRV